MIVVCDKCQTWYDDERRWTICPHNSLNVSHDTPYCRKHDLYNCGVCSGAKLVAPYATFEKPTVVELKPIVSGIDPNPLHRRIQ